MPSSNHLKARSLVAMPMAIIDVGAYSVRLEIVQILEDGRIDVLEDLSHPLPLGDDVFETGRIRPANMRLAEQVIGDFARLMDEYKVERYRALATSAVREAFNRDIFLQGLHQATGLVISPLEGQEEARLIFLAVRKALSGRFSLTKGNAVIFTIGTGSSQLCFMRNGRVTSVETIRLGTLRLVEDDLEERLNPRRLQEVVDPFVAGIFSSIARMSPHAHPEHLIAVGAPVRGLARIASRRHTRHAANLTRETFEKTFARVTSFTAADLIKRYGFRDTVAQSIEPCCHMLDNLFEVTGASRVVIPMINTRDAILDDLLRDLEGEEDPFTPEIISAAACMGDRYRYDARHARHVTDLALNIYDELAKLHGLDKRARLLLEVTGLLHDIGLFVSSRAHHKHSYYLIRNGELPGITQEEQEVIATVARYHRRATPRSSHLEYTSLPPERRVLVSKLAAILRVADALDRSHRQVVRRLRVQCEGDRMMLRAEGPHDLTLEECGLRRKADMFLEVFGYEPVLIGQF